ncbi:MAG: hypothetical protein RLZ10_731 [Bacteroidota bacterium]|jgi:hypothetical protein
MGNAKEVIQRLLQKRNIVIKDEVITVKRFITNNQQLVCGNGTWSKIDYLKNYCGYTVVVE